MMDMISEDCENLESFRELYFGARENDDDIDAENSVFEDSSSESEDDEDEIVGIDVSEVDVTEKAKIEKFVTETCSCKLADGVKPCSTTLSMDDFQENRSNCQELSATELDLVVLGAIQSSLSCSEISMSGRSEKQRKRTRMFFFFHGKRVCKETFLFLHCLSKMRFFSLVKHYKKNGLTLRVHGNKKRLQSSSFSAETVENVVKFIMNIAEEQALLLPGRVPGFKRVDVKLLPSVLTKHSLWKTYVQICASQGQISVGYSKFCDLWNQLCPFVLIMRPATDLCWTCQKNNNLIQKTANLPEAEKAESVRAQEQHLRLDAVERDFYKTCCEQSKKKHLPAPTRSGF